MVRAQTLMPASAAPAVATPAVAGSTLTAALRSYLATRVGTFGCALYDRKSGRWFTYNNYTNQTLSTVKLIIGSTVLRRSQETGRALTSSQRYLMARMIEYSDNSATDSLLAQVGVANVQRVARMYGMTATRVQGMSSGWWGYSTSTPLDMVKLENSVMWGSTVLTRANANYLRSLMRSVTPSQRWGVVGSLPSLADWGIKNGWGPMAGGYRLNSVGHVYGYGRDYNLAIYTRSPNGFYYGRDTINRIGRIVYDKMSTPLA